MTTGERWTLGEQFESQPNALNLIRLLLAGMVVVWHSYALPGNDGLPAPITQLLEAVPVDAFFAISGFLICRAWVHRPNLGRFALARARRLLPGLWACLVVTAFVIAPLATEVSLTGQLRFVFGNATTWVGSWGIDGGPFGVPNEGVWNGSLWSLPREAACYIGVAALGVVGLLRARIVAGAALIFWIVSAAVMVDGGLTPMWFDLLARAGLMFACGALLWFHRGQIPASRQLALACVTLVAIASLTPNYRVLAGPAVAYLCIHAALTLGRHPRLVISNDLSYGLYLYGFPIQQALLLVGVSGGWSFMLVSFAFTIPAAALSWFVVERHALRHRNRKPPALAEARAGAVSG